MVEETAYSPHGPGSPQRPPAPSATAHGRGRSALLLQHPQAPRPPHRRRLPPLHLRRCSSGGHLVRRLPASLPAPPRRCLPAARPFLRPPPPRAGGAALGEKAESRAVALGRVKGSVVVRWGCCRSPLWGGRREFLVVMARRPRCLPLPFGWVFRSFYLVLSSPVMTAGAARLRGRGCGSSDAKCSLRSSRACSEPPKAPSPPFSLAQRPQQGGRVLPLFGVHCSSDFFPAVIASCHQTLELGGWFIFLLGGKKKIMNAVPHPGTLRWLCRSKTMLLCLRGPWGAGLVAGGGSAVAFFRQGTFN